MYFSHNSYFYNPSITKQYKSCRISLLKHIRKGLGKEISVENKSYLKRKDVINKPKILFEEIYHLRFSNKRCNKRDNSCLI